MGSIYPPRNRLQSLAIGCAVSTLQFEENRKTAFFLRLDENLKEVKSLYHIVIFLLIL